MNGKGGILVPAGNIECWKKNLSDKEKLIFATNVFTRMRYLNNDLSLDFNEQD